MAELEGGSTIAGYIILHSGITNATLYGSLTIQDNLYEGSYRVGTVVESETQPSAGLKPGLMWHKPSADETKIYLNGAFREVGGGNKSGTSTFAGAGSSRTIAHGLGTTPSVVMITPSANGNGYIGEYYYTANATNIVVYNTGTATTAFAWVAFK